MHGINMTKVNETHGREFLHLKETAITLDVSGGSFSTAAALFATKPGIVPPFINNHICIMANRIFDVCRQEVSDTQIQIIPSLDNGILLGCEVTQAQCFVCQVDDTDNTINTIQLQVAPKIAYMINVQCKIMHVVRQFVLLEQRNYQILKTLLSTV